MSRSERMVAVDNKMQLALSACRKGHGRQIKDGKQKPSVSMFNQPFSYNIFSSLLPSVGTELQFTSYCDESSNVDIRFISEFNAL